ncbi:glycosyltransferase family 4 protein [Kiloniella sp.]|uniref:glycosyltransferase family 4 protein n=1 Tax=Kiloniella sp. TaxID=1938587 RepID=UPI003A8EB79E
MKLLIILNDPLSPLLEKGEATERYYNPGNVFDEVHIVLCNDDRPDLGRLKPMVGSAQLILHNLSTPSRFYWRTLGWREMLMEDWLNRAKVLAQQIQPDLIRCHGAHINATAARAIRAVSGAPVLLSLHSRPDAPPVGLSFPDRLRHEVLSGLAERELRAADLVFAVYQSQLPYLKRIGVKEVELAYNVLNPGKLAVKDDYAIRNEARILSVGRLIPGKNPENLIRAMTGLKGASLTLVGDGPLREQLEGLSDDLGLSDRVTFIPSMDNDLLCQSLSEFDIFAAHNDYPGVPKAVMEPLLSGLPVLINKVAGEIIPELTEEICLLTENTLEGYRSGLKKILCDDVLREKLGKSAKVHAERTWNPDKTEARYASIYRSVLQKIS